MDNCEARTRSAKKNAAAANNVVWNQKIAFPACSARSLIIDVADQRPGFSESNPRGLVASKAILVDALPWDLKGQMPGFVGRLGNVHIKMANNGNGVAP
jgi:hypothetical protein